MSFAQNRPVTSETGSYTYKNPGFSPKPRFLYAYDYYFFLQNFISLLILLGKLYLPARNQICFVFSFSFSISVLLSSVLSRYLRYLEKKKYITIPTTTICTSIGKPFANTAFRRLERIHRVTSIHICSCYRRSDMRIFR